MDAEFAFGLGAPVESSQHSIKALREPVCPLRRHGLVTTPVVPFAHPYNVLWRRRGPTDRTHFRFALLTEMDCSLNPGLEMSSVLLGQLLDELSKHVPVQSGHQVLMVWSLGNSGCSLAGRFL